MKKFPRSPYDRVGGLVYFARMLDKIRLHAAGELPEDYQANLGIRMDDRCVRFLSVGYPALRVRALQGGTDAEVLEWCFATGRRPTPEEISVWNSYMRKRGWRDDDDGATLVLNDYKAKAGMSNRRDVLTFFDFFDADEGRKR